jgi:hypothetical protein
MHSSPYSYLSFAVTIVAVIATFGTHHATFTTFAIVVVTIVAIPFTTFTFSAFSIVVTTVVTITFSPFSFAAFSTLKTIHKQTERTVRYSILINDNLKQPNQEIELLRNTLGTPRQQGSVLFLYRSRHPHSCNNHPMDRMMMTTPYHYHPSFPSYP